MKRHEKKFLFLAGLIVATIFVLGGSTSSGTSYADDREPDRTAAPTSGAATSDPGQVVIASGSNRFAVWQDLTPGNLDIFFRRSTNNGATWGPKVTISTADTDNSLVTNPQVAATGAFVYVTWYDFGAKDAFFRRSINSGGSFQGVVNLSNSGTVDDLDSNRVALAAAGTNVYVAWDDFYASKDVKLRASTNNGATFSGVKDLTGTGGVDAHGPDLAATGSNVYATWTDIVVSKSWEAFFARSTNSGGTFSAKINLSNNAGTSDLSQVAFSGVNVFVTWQDSSVGNSDILMRRSINSGSSFQAFKNLSSNAGVSLNPQVATSGANVYFTWNDSTPGNFDIFLRRSMDNGATLQPLVQISNNAGASQFPQVTTVGANVYIIWQDNSPGNNDIIERRSSNNGATWQPTQNLSSNAGSSELPQIDG